MIVYYHSRDLDGKCSAAIIRSVYPECELYGIDYGEDFPWEKVIKGETTFMVDFSLPIADMLKLNKLCHLVWIDHHISAINEYREAGVNFRGIRSIQKAGCQLTWDYCYPNVKAPQVVDYLGFYDIWQHTENVLEFQMGARMLNLEPDAKYNWEPLLEGRQELIDTIITNGRLILQYQDSQNKEICAKNSFEIEFEGLSCIALNGGFGSRIFNSVWSDKYDMMITFSTDGIQWRVSLYQDGRPNVDCSVIAKKYGGGGHKGAAGFQCKELPFPIVK